ncbi:t-SNARE [Corchorus olitorius]|uniref:t-SNARE n=1 Tax=Corchorus olitorius TaxID=93759 RepID=A0A1R3HJZ7_9ROSI|nr:t-SNARE [Corchorus olitorius]
MASSFDRWEKDPFFSVAEEVQESADRMESTYRTWLHAKRDASSKWNIEELRRDLRTTLGTTKWQLEEFEKAVKSSYKGSSSEDARDRHREFIVAIEDHISRVEKSLQESALSEGKTSMPWVRLDEGECNELALFLSGPSVSGDKKFPPKSHSRNNEIPSGMDKESVAECSKNSSQSIEWSSSEAKGEKSYGHRRTASASADIGIWKIAIADDVLQQNSSNGQPSIPPRKVPSVSGFLNSMESMAKLKWSNNGIRKWKAVDRHQESDTELLQPPQLDRGINECYERSKSCLDCDDCYDKQLYGWYGAIQRQLQRSQYQMQYGRPIQLAGWVVLFVCLIGELP